MAELTGEAKQRYVADLFASIAGRYDLMNNLMTGGRHLSWKRKTAQLAAHGLTGRALDVATGTGDLALALAQCPQIEQAVGVDILPQMVALAQEKARAKGRAAKTVLLLGDAMELPFPDSSFACATSGFSLRNMSDLARALAEMARVVRPGGRVVTLELTPMESGVKSTLFFRTYFHRLVPLMGQLMAGNRAAYTYLRESVDYFPEAERLAEMLREEGLVSVGYRRLGLGTVSLHWGNKPTD